MPVNHVRSIRIRVGDLELTPLVKSAEVMSAYKNDAEFSVRLRLDPALIAQVDWARRMIFETEDDGQAASLMHGFVMAAKIEGGEVVLNGKGLMQLAEEVRTGGAFGKGIPPDEMIYLMMKASMPDNVSPDGISSLDGKGTLADRIHLFRRRTFTYITPVLALQALNAPKSLGNGYLYDWTRESGLDDEFIKLSFKEEMPAEWQHPVRVRMFVESTELIEAFDEGRARSDEVLDLVAFALNRTTLTSATGVGWSTYDRKMTGLSTTRGSWSYVRDLQINMDRYWTRWAEPTLREGSSAVSTYLDGAALDAVTPFFSQSDRYRSREVKRIIRAIRALRQAHESSNATDGVHHLWRAVEYLASTEDIPDGINRSEKLRLKRTVKSAVDAEFGDDPSRADALAKRLIDLMKFINEPPLRTKWIRMNERVGVAIPEQDERFLWGLRKSRNDDTHGNVADVPRDDLLRGLSIVEKATLGAALAMEQPWRFDWVKDTPPLQGQTNQATNLFAGLEPPQATESAAPPAHPQG